MYGDLEVCGAGLTSKLPNSGIQEFVRLLIRIVLTEVGILSLTGISNSYIYNVGIILTAWNHPFKCTIRQKMS